MTNHTLTKYVRNLIAAGTIAAATMSAKADYHTLDATIDNGNPKTTQVRAIDTIRFDKWTYDGFNQATTGSYTGDNTLFGNTTIAPLVKLLSTQESVGKVVPGVRVSLPYASLDVGYLNGGVHAKAKAWKHALGIDWYATQITNAAPKQKPFSLSEIEATKMLSAHAGIVGRATWFNFSGKPKLEIGAKYMF